MLKNNIKKIILLMILVIDLFAFRSCLNIFVYADSDADTSKLELNKKDINALGAILIDFYSGRILWEKDAHKKLAMASTTKIMTAILALENKNLDLEDQVIISKSVLAVPKVKLNLSPGEKIKLKYLLLALMLESSNDAAVAIAEHISGDVNKFCELMTQKAKEIGANNTNFQTPNGLDKENHFSTAYDMAIITRYAFKNPEFIKLINTPNASFSSDKKTYVLNNKNRLLREFDGANGVKTGFTGKAGHCFVGAAKKNNMQLISVVLGSGWGPKGKEAKWSDTKKILNYGFENYSYKKIINKNLIAGQVKINHSRTKNLNLIYDKDLILPVNLSEQRNLEIKINVPEILEAPIKKNQVLGSAKIFINNKYITQTKILAANNISRHDLKTSLKKIFSIWARTIKFKFNFL